MKRGQAWYGENHSNGKLRRQEGIKRSLHDILPVSYGEYYTSWDIEDQSKRCKKSVNCLLVHCTRERGATRDEPMREQLEDDVTPANTSHNMFLPVCEAPAVTAEQGKQDRTIYTAAPVQPDFTPD